MGTTEPAAQPLEAEFAQAFAERFLDAWNSHRSDRLTELCHPEVLWEDPFISGGYLVGHAALREWLTSVWRALPDLRFVLHGPVHIALDRLSLMADWTGTATMTGPLDPPGFAPTNRPVTMSGVDRHWLADGRLVHVRTVTDVMSVARQIGAAPAVGSRAERLGALAQHIPAMRQRRSAARTRPGAATGGE